MDDVHKRAIHSETQARQMRIDFQKFDYTKLSISDHEDYATKRQDITDKLGNKIDDTYNRLVESEVYLDKYLPYNTFV